MKVIVFFLWHQCW